MTSKLPKPTGPFNVGCFDLMTQCKSIPKTFDIPSLCSEETDLGSLTQIYYPCDESIANNHRHGSWLPEQNQKWYFYGLLKPMKIGWLGPLIKCLLGRYGIPTSYIF